MLKPSRRSMLSVRAVLERKNDKIKERGAS
jgi:hypothetical protein